MRGVGGWSYEPTCINQHYKVFNNQKRQIMASWNWQHIEIACYRALPVILSVHCPLQFKLSFNWPVQSRLHRVKSNSSAGAGGCWLAYITVGWSSPSFKPLSAYTVRFCYLHNLFWKRVLFNLLWIVSHSRIWLHAPLTVQIPSQIGVLKPNILINSLSS